MLRSVSRKSHRLRTFSNTISRCWKIPLPQYESHCPFPSPPLGCLLETWHHDWKFKVCSKPKAESDLEWRPVIPSRRRFCTVECLRLWTTGKPKASGCEKLQAAGREWLGRLYTIYDLWCDPCLALQGWLLSYQAGHWQHLHSVALLTRSSQ